ncbi:MAG TPA: isoprenylcysteine carboxylmethyltransferase family protein [Opitutaceae bacterium]|nr:isoprenylcysteine carboxylmethyltransferase family protein [Opitutaceae bacterium]
MTARLLVALQFGLLVVLGFPPGTEHGRLALALGVMAVGGCWLGWTLAVNPPPNIHIRPVPKAGGRLVTAGPYRLVRHPMYLGVLVIGAGPVVLWLGALKLAAWLALGAVLVAKARLEEAALIARFPEYESYRRGRRFLIPGVWKPGS